MDGPLSGRDLIAEAYAATDLTELRRRTFEHLEKCAPFDMASFIPMGPAGGPVVRTIGGPDRYFQLFSGNPGRYLAGMEKAKLAARELGAYIDAAVFDADERDRLPLYVDILKPQNVTNRIVAYVSFKQSLFGTIHLCRYGRGSPFSRDDLIRVCRLLPAIGVASAAFASAPPPTVSDSPLAKLSARETEVARLVGRGLGNKEIAALFGTSTSTVRKQTMSIFSKLRVAGRTELAVMVRLGERPHRDGKDWLGGP